MAVFLDEDQIGSDAGMIGYPHLLLCMGVTVVMSDGSLIGAHVSNADTEQQVMGRLLQDITAHGGAMSQLYCAANVAEHVGRHGCGDITAKANMLGFHGPGYLFDFNYIKPKDGAYVEVSSNGAAHAATLRFKRNEKVAYTVTGAGPQVTKATKNFFGVPKTYTQASNAVAATGKAKTLFGKVYGQHQIKTVPASSLTTFAF